MRRPLARAMRELCVARDITAFARLLGLQRSDPARERLDALRNKHGLSDGDPLWDMLAIVEGFCAELRADSVAQSPSASLPEPSPSDLRSPVLWRIAVIGSAGAALQTFALAASFAAGTRMAHVSDPLSGVLAVPAGWVVFVLLLPLLTALACLGWRARRTEPAIGWSLIVCGVGTAVAVFAVLWRLL